MDQDITGILEQPYTHIGIIHTTSNIMHQMAVKLFEEQINEHTIYDNQSTIYTVQAPKR